MNVTLIGDTHSKFLNGNYFSEIINPIVLGDFCIYPIKEHWRPARENPVAFIDGNHDHFPSFDKNAISTFQLASNLTYIPRGFISGKVLFIGGGDSIDKNRRTPGLDWWPEESISQIDLQRTVNAIHTSSMDIEVVISHTCPHFVLYKIFPELYFFDTPSEHALDIVYFEILKRNKGVPPKAWFFGHWHMNRQINIKDTLFTCLGINQSLYLDNLEVNPLDFPQFNR